MIRSLVCCLSLGMGVAWGQNPSPNPSPVTRPSTEISNKAKKLPVRPGWRLVDGGWVRPETKISFQELIRVVVEHDTHRIKAQPATRIGPLLRNWRTSVVELEGSDYAWKLSCVGRQWDAFRSEPTDHLQLIAAMDDAVVDRQLRLTLLRISPENTVVQAAIIDRQNVPRSVLLVLSPDTVELAIAPLGESRTDLIFRTRTTWEFIREYPEEARLYLIPLIHRLSGGQMTFLPAAGDVYRVFDDLKPDPDVLEIVRRIIPDLSSPDPVIRERASRELASLKRPGVLAAMRIDRRSLHPEAADRIEAFIQNNTTDSRTSEQLLADDAFLADCLNDPDPRVRHRARVLLSKNNR
ncbi:MAG: hypothetical protein KatS3mg104_2441 [Phycisphaerae bacterium]|nr:MAG: hypothetical protein KatS3mg104_2441 [Phycisphaerae bacterium]